MSAYNDLQAQLFEYFTTEAKALDIRQQATERRAEEVRDAGPARRREEDDRRQARRSRGPARKLKAEEREALLSRGSVRFPSGIDASGAAAAALRYAMAQVGKAYV